MALQFSKNYPSNLDKMELPLKDLRLKEGFDSKHQLFEKCVTKKTKK